MVYFFKTLSLNTHSNFKVVNEGDLKHNFDRVNDSEGYVSIFVIDEFRLQNSGHDRETNVEKDKDGGEAKQDYVQVHFDLNVRFVWVAQVQLLTFCKADDQCNDSNNVDDGLNFFGPVFMKILKDN